MAFDAVVNNADWAKPGFINPYVQAAIDRRAVSAGFIAPSLVSVGEDAQDYSGVMYKMQGAASSYSHWYDPVPTPESYDGTDLSGLVGYASTAALLADAGLDEAGGFRRIPSGGALPANWEDYGDDAYSYGRCEEGDIIGPWLFVDLQAMFGKMTRTNWDATNVNDARWYAGYADGEATAAAARAAAEADYKSVAFTDGPPQRFAGCYYRGAGDFDATIISVEMDVETADGPDGLSKTVSVFAHAWDGGGYVVFDAEDTQSTEAVDIGEEVYNLAIQVAWEGTGATEHIVGAWPENHPDIPPNWHPDDPVVDSTIKEYGWKQLYYDVIVDWAFGDQP